MRRASAAVGHWPSTGRGMPARSARLGSRAGGLAFEVLGATGWRRAAYSTKQHSNDCQISRARLRSSLEGVLFNLSVQAGSAWLCNLLYGDCQQGQ